MTAGEIAKVIDDAASRILLVSPELARVGEQALAHAVCRPRLVGVAIDALV